MRDDELTRENVIAVSFSDDANAYEALSRLTQLDAKGEVGVRAAGVVARSEDGTIAMKDQFGEETVERTVTGGLVGLVIGVRGVPSEC
jgi:uncharacterized membrane protein